MVRRRRLPTLEASFGFDLLQVDQKAMPVNLGFPIRPTGDLGEPPFAVRFE
jgi:hypothetical protein